MTAEGEQFLTMIEVEGCQKVKEHLKRLYNIWSELGLDTDQKTSRVKVVWGHLYNLLGEITNEENELCESIKQRIESYTRNIQDLCTELAVTPKEMEGSLVKKEELLRLELDSLSKLKHKRVKGYQELKKVESKFCQILGYKEHQLPLSAGVPSEKDVIELEQHVKMLQDEHERRYRKYCTFKKELTTIFETTELTPESTLEKEILSSKDTISLSNDTFKAFEEIISRAQKKRLEMEARKKFLLDKLSTLWQRLQMDERLKKEFLSKHADCRVSTIKALELELERCEKIKRENLKSFITSLRAELRNLWDKCSIPEHERQLFHLYYSSEVSDEILSAHELEVEKWKRHHAEIEHILKKIEKRKELWELMIVFENKAADPNRFKNRKGNLLQEERERKKLQKELPALENEIFKEIEAYEAGNASTFQYNGEDFRTFVTNQWTERINQKENLKQERHQKHLGNETTPAKRPLKTIPKSAPSKLFKSSAGTSAFRTPIPNKSRVVPNTVGKLISKFSCRPSTIKKKEQESKMKSHGSPRVLRARNQQDPHPQTSADTTTYTDFAAELNTTARHQCRSSVLAGRVRTGSRITLNSNSRSKRKSASKSLRSSSKSAPDFTPARGKLGLPFLI